MGEARRPGGVIRDPNRLPTCNYLPMCDDAPEPGHLLTFGCPCRPLVTWIDDMMEITHYPLYPATDEGDCWMVSDEDEEYYGR